MFKKIKLINKERKDVIEIDPKRLMEIDNNRSLEGGIFIKTGKLEIEKIGTRVYGILKNKAIFLPNSFNYELVIDNDGYKCLVVLKKEENL